MMLFYDFYGLIHDHLIIFYPVSPVTCVNLMSLFSICFSSYVQSMHIVYLLPFAKMLQPVREKFFLPPVDDKCILWGQIPKPFQCFPEQSRVYRNWNNSNKRVQI